MTEIRNMEELRNTIMQHVSSDRRNAINKNITSSKLCLIDDLIHLSIERLDRCPVAEISTQIAILYTLSQLLRDRRIPDNIDDYYFEQMLDVLDEVSVIIPVQLKEINEIKKLIRSIWVYWIGEQSPDLYRHLKEIEIS